MPDIGSELKSARKARGLSLKALAEDTCISTRFLLAMEEENFDELPGGLFRRGFIRTYARKLGLDAEALVAEYAARYEAPPAADPDGGGGNGARAGESPRRYHETWPDRHAFPVAVVGLVVLIVLFYAFGRGDDPAPGTGAGRLEAPPAALSEAPGPALPGADAAVPGGATSPLQLLTFGADGGEGAGVSIQIEVHDPTWIWLESDGEEVVQGIVLGPGERRLFTAQQALELKIGNAAGLTLSINGREVPNLGRTGQVRTLTITPDNVSRLTGG